MIDAADDWVNDIGLGNGDLDEIDWVRGRAHHWLIDRCWWLGDES